MQNTVTNSNRCEYEKLSKQKVVKIHPDKPLAILTGFWEATNAFLHPHNHNRKLIQPIEQ